MEHRNSGSKHHAHIQESTGQHVTQSDGEESVVKTGYYTLPTCRFTILVQVLLFTDLVSSVALWLCGGDSGYLEKNVMHFKIKDSVFDLAAIAFVKCSILFFSYHWLENFSTKQIDYPYERRLALRKCWCHFLAIILSLGSLAYSVTKGVLIYKEESQEKHKLHATYFALVISSVAFSFLETVFALSSFVAMRRLKLMRILHTPNDTEAKRKPKVNLGRLMTLAKPELLLLLMASLALLASSGAQIAAPFFFGKVIQAATEKGMKHLNETIVILALVYLGGALAALVRAWLFTLAGQRLVARIRKQLFNSILHQEVAFFDNNRTGELINRLSSDTQVIQNALTVNVSMLLRYIFQIVGSLVFMFTLSAKLTGVLISVVPIVGIGAQQYGSYVQGLRKKFQDELAAASATAEESIGNIRTVRSFSQERKAMGNYGTDINKSYKVGAKLALFSGLFQGVIGIIGQGAVVLVLWYGGNLVNHGELNVGILTAFMLYTLNVAMAFAFLSSLYGDFMQAVGASVRMFQLMDRLPAINAEGGQKLHSVNQTIQFQEVCFAYPSRPDTDVLKGMSFELRPGQTVALVGPSGGGKSTVISLIERFYDPKSGIITIGGTNLGELDLFWMRRKIALVSQEPVLFATTIAGNIAYGCDATQEEIEEVAVQANAHAFITEFEEGYQTQVGERGVKLSGGQKQRVAIARALLMNPDILLLDEATSALDAESEHFVKEAIDRAMKNRTVLVIAHRLSTVRNADQVLVIDKGQIVERGTHKDLLASEGVYKKLVLRQLSTSQGASVAADDSFDPDLWEAGKTPIDEEEES
ncbi:ABC transporter B family member 1-like [Stylophora pistillata]|uniref:ABC transporter B family member 1 n=1 Tax=Stylophora pistillata TaxID=50429 RepID=A0A2B4SJD4_STYPI|nr:ABC transporter B family member 1-like [Stylophora pistillata]PFX28535.1 ABC transporter B family member 1 [Stylophora pistillata]